MEKSSLRVYAKKLLASLSKERREEAAFALLTLLKDLPYKYILSFVSLQTEINTQNLNATLLEQKRLLLPKFQNNEILPIAIDEETEFEISRYEILTPLSNHSVEPNLILVPALLFDANNHRLGRGKGYYDRLLSKYTHIPSFGIGFQEQLLQDPLPTTSWDRPVSQLFLY